MSRINASRRIFLRTSAVTSLAGAGAPFAMNLAAMSAAHAADATGYKALVCVFLGGGNDHANMVLPTDAASWAAYRSARNVSPAPITLPEANVGGGVLPIVPNTPQVSPNSQPGPRTFALHPSMGALRTLFDNGRAAIVANVGPLIRPVSRAQWNARSVPLPPQLFSHNDQTSIWQAYRPEGARIGWGGRLGDLFAAQNGRPPFTLISASGNAVFLAGENVMQFQANGGNAGAQIGNLNSGLFGASTANNPLRAIITNEQRANLFEKEHARVVARSIETSEAMRTAVNSVTVATPPANNNLASQLQSVARIIAARNTLGMRRQVFYVSMGGFDTHDNQTGNHATLMQRLADALAYFDGVMTTLGVGSDVTTFTASEFGRTLTSNGDGTDHGWGAHHIVVGGAVRGRDIYGAFPTIALNDDDNIGQGRLLPKISVDQYAGTLARWFGLTDSEVAAPTMFPNIVNFPTRNLGFMNAIV
jgi:uncharacterized protein (DUF1501 family)